MRRTPVERRTSGRVYRGMGVFLWIVGPGGYGPGGIKKAPAITAWSLERRILDAIAFQEYTP